MHLLRLIGSLSMIPLFAACGGGSSGAGGSGGESTVVCDLVDDPGSPGQYADTCVKREWAEPHLGKYTSASCELTITAPSGGPAAVFALTVTDAALGGTYTHDWEGGTGMGNDSYYLFTTDTTYATVTAINFGVGRKVSDIEEHSIGFRINEVNTASPSYSGYFQKTVTSPFSNENVDCGVLVKAP